MKQNSVATQCDDHVASLAVQRRQSFVGRALLPVITHSAGKSARLTELVSTTFGRSVVIEWPFMVEASQELGVTNLLVEVEVFDQR